MKLKIFGLLAAGLLAAGLLAPIAYATPFHVGIQGALTKDIFSTSFFGITDPSVPFQLSFDIDDADAVLVPSGTPIVPSGFGLAADAFLFSSASVSNLLFDIGNVSFSSADLVTQGLGTSGYSFGVLLLGALSDGGISAAQMRFNNGSSGDVSIGNLVCFVNPCVMQNYGAGESYTEASLAELSGMTFDIEATQAVPDPATLSLLGLGLAGIGIARLRKKF